MKNKTVMITGASSGFGEACAEAFAREGCNLIIVARRKERINTLSAILRREYGIDVFFGELDVRNRGDVNDFFNNLPEKWQKIDILVNNAGLASGFDNFQDYNIDDWEAMVDTNIKGLLYVSRAVLPLMIKYNIKGHIINIGSIAGIYAYPKGAVYCGTKAAVHTISDGIRMDVVEHGIKVTNIQPGLAETEFSLVRFHGDEDKAKAVYNGLQALSAADVAETVLFAASRPAHVQIAEITLTPLCQASAMVVRRNS